MNAGRSLFRQRRAHARNLLPARRSLRVNLLQQVLDHALFVRSRGRIDPLVALLQLHALVDLQSHVAAVIHHQLRAQSPRELQRLLRAPPVLLQRLALPRKHRNARRRNRRRRMILGREDVAARPAHIRAQRNQRLNQHGRLNRHMQRSGNAHARQRLARGILVADGHQSGHLALGNVDLFGAQIPPGQCPRPCTPLPHPKLPYRSLPSPCKTPHLKSKLWSGKAQPAVRLLAIDTHSGYHPALDSKPLLCERSTSALSGVYQLASGNQTTSLESSNGDFSLIEMALEYVRIA